MSAAGSYPRSNVKHPGRASAARSRPRDKADERDDESPEPIRGGAADDEGQRVAERVDLSGLSVAGISRRRVGWVAAGLVSIWIVVVFARQVGDATAAAAAADQLARDNAALAAEVRSLEGEVGLIVRPEYVSIQARAYQLGDPREIPFALSPAVPAPTDGSPGSAAVRLGATDTRQTPLESWLSLLFGPGG